MELWPFKVDEDDTGRPLIKAKFGEVEKTFKPEEISAMILERLKADASEHLSQEIKEAVITVPAYFDNR